jgi:hypothetical protein
MPLRTRLEGLIDQIDQIDVFLCRRGESPSFGCRQLLTDPVPVDRGVAAGPSLIGETEAIDLARDSHDFGVSESQLSLYQSQTRSGNNEFGPIQAETDAQRRGHPVTHVHVVTPMR